jgi:hypothetical protein
MCVRQPVESFAWRRVLRSSQRCARVWGFFMTAHQASVFTLLAIGTGVACYFIYPPAEDVSKLPADFDLHIDSSALVKDSRMPSISKVLYEEWHHPTVVSVSILFADQNSKPDAQINIRIKIPYRGATIVGCKIQGGGQNPCHIDSSAPDPGMWENEQSDVLTVSGQLRSIENTFEATVFLSDRVPGVGFKTTRTHVETHLPNVGISTDYYRDPNLHPKVSVVYRMPSADKYTWSGNTPQLVPAGGGISWSYTSSSPDDPAPPPASGTRDDLTAQDGRRTFLAGVLLGVAGGAIVAALQSAFAGRSTAASTGRRVKRAPAPRPIDEIQ